MLSTMRARSLSAIDWRELAIEDGAVMVKNSGIAKTIRLITCVLDVDVEVVGLKL